jgi:ABC-type transport system involved in cytochrome c biogenesis permease subunit
LGKPTRAMEKMGQDEFIIGYAILYVCTIVKIIFLSCTRWDMAILFIGAGIFYRRYLRVMELDRMCREIKPMKISNETLSALLRSN